MNSRFLSIYEDKHECIHWQKKVREYATVKNGIFGMSVSLSHRRLKRAVGKMKPTGQFPF